MNKTDYDKSGLSAEQIKTLIESEARYKALISGFPDLLFLFSEDGDILDVHAEDESLLVKKPAELLGKNIRSLLPQDLVELALHAIGEVRKKGTIYTYEYELSVGHSRYFESRFIACGADKYLNIVRDITIKKLAQQKVIESEVKYKALLEANPDLMFLLSEEGVFLDYYAAENTHLYAPPDVFLNKNIRDVLPEELANLTLNSIKAVKETGQIQTYEYQLTFDEPRYFEARMVACGNNEYLSIVREFTDNKKAEEQLRASEEKYRKIFETANECILCVDKDCNINLLNHKTTELLGYSMDELIGKPFDELLFPEDIADHEREMDNRVIGKIGYYERRFCRKDGTEVWVIVSSTPVMDEKGEFGGSFGMLTDITDRKAMEAKLQASEELYRKLFETANEGIWIVDSQGKTAFSNQRMADMLGYTIDELSDKQYVDLLLPEDLDDYYIKVEQRKAGKSSIYERRLIRKDGSFMWATVSATPLFEKDGTSISSFAMYTDITERKHAELNMQDTLKRFQEQRNILAAIATSADVYNGDVNAVAKEICSTACEQFSYHRVGVWLYNEDGSVTTSLNLYDLSTKEHTSGIVLNSAGKNEEYAYFKKVNYIACEDPQNDKRISSYAEEYIKPLHVTALLDAVIRGEGRMMGIVGIEYFDESHHWSEDEISFACQLANQMALTILNRERIIAEDVISNNEKELRKLTRAVEQSPVSIVITDTNGKIEFVNEYFTELTGFTYEESIGMNPNILQSGHTPNEIYQDLWNTILSGQPWMGEFQNRKKNGELYWEEACISPVTDTNGEIINLIGVKEDITVKKQMTIELIKAKEDAEQMNKIKSSFLANMSHELRTPLVGILGYSELLSNMLHEEETQEMAVTINASGKRLLHTLNLILDLSRIEANQQEIHKEDIELNHFLKERVKLFEVVARAKELDLSYISHCKELYVCLDSRLLEHIVNDLINNAIKYTDTGKVTVRLDVEQTISGHEIRIRVIDTGIGIPKKQQSVIFDAFRQVSEGYNRSFEGTGLGLTITKKYVELLGGKIALESEVGKGSTFTICFSEDIMLRQTGKAETDDKSADTDDSAPVLKIAQKPKVLFIDDDKISWLLVQKMIADITELDYAETGDKAMTLVKKNKYDMILLDINLPRGISGFEVLEKLRKMKDYDKVPIVAVTAYSMLGDREKFLNAGCTDYLSKPFSKEDLVNALNSHLQH